MTMYDVKAGVRKVQNGLFFPSARPLRGDATTLLKMVNRFICAVAMMNYTEMEAKVSDPMDYALKWSIFA